MEYKVFSDQDRVVYSEFLLKHTACSFLQAWEWGQWRSLLGEESLRFGIYDDHKLVLTAQCLKVTVPLFGYQYFYIPHGPVIDEGLDDAQRANVLSFFLQHLRKHFSQCIFIRFELPAGTSSDLAAATGAIKSVNIQSAKTLWVDLQIEPELLLAQMHNKTRYNIKVAQKHGVSVTSHRADENTEVTDVIKLIVDTQIRQHYRGHGFDYYKKLLHCFSQTTESFRVSTYEARYQEKLLATGIMVDFGQTRMYLFGGSSDEQRNVMAPYLMHWQAMQDAKKLGLRFYDFGGSETAGGEEEKGFSRFKSGFGGELISYPGAYDSVVNSFSYKIYSLARRLGRWLRKGAPY